ncbi:hypothetical protein [Dinghuibacter silviterrae]|uniref:Uncharacterized protein n=1 Tax=Dinghuibacter silviterrae TaxID=1539049 RepID=A0A4R8DIU6_9BACT|nr:hypothetical protein [Dinghuibacter silviterrae]TDW97487.1 hypothetical protein EDB95_5337 [Dinghuibacter silviterrae]
MATGIPQINNLRNQRDTADTQVYQNNLQLQQVQAQLQKAIQQQAPNVPQLQAQLAVLQASQVTAKQNLAGALGALNQAIVGLYAAEGPQQLIGSWSDQVPIALLPVRVETRFGAGNPSVVPPVGTVPPVTTAPVRANAVVNPAVPELWVRVYPDDVAVITDEKTLTAGEVTAGETYWQALYTAITTGAGDDPKKAAWSTLVTSFGSGRAAWVALQTQPTNWSSDLTGISQLIFPTFNLTKTQAWSRAPRTKVMPDKFVLMLYNGNTVVAEQTGNVIPDDLIVGPDPADQGSFVTSGNQLNFGPDFDWSSDFDKAVSLGMGFRVPITTIQAQEGFDKLLVLGLYLSNDAPGTQQVVEDLIDSHHYSSQGFSLVPQGMSTSNTANASSGFTKTDPFDNLSYLVEAGAPLFTAGDDCDGKNMADALGLDYSVLQHVAYSDGTDNRDAVLMNTCLYPGTLGYYVDSLLNPVLNLTAQASLQDFFTRFVTGRGPLPAFRVGNQPYGLLLTSDFSAWQADKTPFQTTLYKVLSDYQAIWNSLLGQLMYAGKPGTDPTAVLTNVLGLQPASATFFQRNAYSSDNLWNLDDFEYGGKYFSEAQKNFISKEDGMFWLQSFGYTGGAIPQILRLIYQHYTTTLDPANLVDKVPITETNPLSLNYLTWLAGVTGIDQLNQQNFGTGVTPPNTLLYLMLRKALLQALHTASVNWFLGNGADFSATLGAINFHNIRPGGTLTKWEVMKAPLSTVAPANPLAKLAVADYLLGPGKTEVAAQVPQAIVSALTELSTRSTASLERTFIEHIDALTYRLDAWQTGMFDVRLRNMRQSANSDRGRAQGIYLGAYGWLENIRPSGIQKVPAASLPPQLQPADNSPVYQYAGNGGLVHAPSINHASTAAVLRSGYLTHADAGAPGTLSVNLSSERVRRGLTVMEGIRNGQTLNALLGYQFERGLHDRASADISLLLLNDYIYDFRAAFPLQQTIVQQQGGGAQETLPATDVVDGLALAGVTAAFPYGATGDVTTATPAQIAAIQAEKDNLADTLDAVKDMLTVESVYQLVQGNYDRASATLGALQNSDLPPVLDSIDTPRGNQFSFTNRVTVQFANAATANPWPSIPLTARATTETGINLWLGSLLGAPTGIAVQVAQLDTGGNPVSPQNIGLDQLGIQPIDLVYLIEANPSTGAPRPGQEARTGASELERRFAYAYRKANNLADSVAVNISFLQPQPGKKALGQLLPLLRSLRTLITGSRYLNAQDFDPPAQTGLADPNNPSGYDATELLTRIQAAKTAYEQQLQNLKAIPIQAGAYNNLGAVFTALDNAQQTFADITFTLQNADALTLRDQMIALANLGYGEAFPTVTAPSTALLQTTLLEQARSVSGQMTAADQSAATQLTQAQALTDISAQTAALIDAAKTLLGSDFNMLPLFRYNNESDILKSDADRAQLLSYAAGDFPADEWMQSAAMARPALASWDMIRLLCETGGTPLPLKPVQVPYVAQDNWLAVEFPAGFTITQDTLSIVIHGDQAFTPGAPHCGLMIDAWTESIPSADQVTGITFNYNQPNAFPPQAVLLAVPPVLKGAWDWNELVGILNDTLLRAKLRAVEPQLLATTDKIETSVLLPAVLSNFTQYDLDISLDYRLNLASVFADYPVKAILNN